MSARGEATCQEFERARGLAGLAAELTWAGSAASSQTIERKVHQLPLRWSVCIDSRRRSVKLLVSDDPSTALRRWHRRRSGEVPLVEKARKAAEEEVAEDRG